MSTRVILFALTVLAQFALPVHMIRDRETVLREGTRYRFKTQPIDPADPFQGRYVWLSIEQDYIACKESTANQIDYKTPGYASIAIDNDGFAYFKDWHTTKPTTGDYLATRAQGKAHTWEIGADDRRHSTFKGMRIEIPFTRFYMDETKAPRAEILARDATRHGDCWVEVRILNGKAVIEDVAAVGQSLRDLVAIE